MENAFRVSVRLQRVMTDRAAVLVPITPEVMKPDPAGERRWTVDEDSSTKWLPQGPAVIRPYPNQTPQPGG